MQPTIAELLQQLEDAQIEILVLRESISLLISRLIVSGIVDQAFLDDMSICAEGLDSGRAATFSRSAPDDLVSELDALQKGVRSSRYAFFDFVERLVKAFRH